MNVGRIRDEKITLSSDFSNGCLFLYDLAWSSLRSLSSHAVFPCPSHQRSSLWFLECHRGIFHTSQLVIILCSPLRYSTRRPNLSLCVTFVFLLFSSLFVQLTFPSFFHCDLLAFVPGCTTLSPHPPSPPPPHFCREFPCEKPCSQGLSAFESAEKPGLIARDTSDSKNKVIHLFSIINVIQQPLKLAQGMFGFYFVQWLVLLPR